LLFDSFLVLGGSNTRSIRADINNCECAKRRLSDSDIGIAIGIAIALGIGIGDDHDRDCDRDTDSDPDSLPISDAKYAPWVRVMRSKMPAIRIYL